MPRACCLPVCRLQALSWQFDAFKFDRRTQGHPLINMTIALLELHNLMVRACACNNVYVTACLSLCTQIWVMLQEPVHVACSPAVALVKASV